MDNVVITPHVASYTPKAMRSLRESAAGIIVQSIEGKPLPNIVNGVTLRPVLFEPTFQKHAGQSCRGVQVHVTDPWVFRPYEAYLRMLGAVLPSVDASARWRTEEYEFVTDRPAIDLLTGGPEFREAVDAGEPLDEVLVAEARGAAQFDSDRRASWLYDAK